MLKEDAMTYTDENTDRHSLYVLLGSLGATLISLPVVWILTAATYAPGLVA